MDNRTQNMKTAEGRDMITAKHLNCSANRIRMKISELVMCNIDDCLHSGAAEDVKNADHCVY